MPPTPAGRRSLESAALSGAGACDPAAAGCGGGAANRFHANSPTTMTATGSRNAIHRTQALILGSSRGGGTAVAEGNRHFGPHGDRLTVDDRRAEHILTHRRLRRADEHRIVLDLLQVGTE